VDVTERRRGECERVVSSTVGWAEGRTDVRAVGIAGSWARGTAAMSSDLDLVVLTDAKESYVDDDGWIAVAAGSPGRLIRTRAWGPLTERRVALESGFEVEYGFAPTSWASSDPVDPGTAEVVAAGFRVVYDPDGLIARLVRAVH
jgi:hypothetical protein